MTPLPLQLPLLIFAGWVNRQQQEMIDYLQEENREQTASLAWEADLTWRTNDSNAGCIAERLLS